MQHSRRHGRGVMVVSDGSMYDGDWVDGKTHGTGIRVYGERGKKGYGAWPFLS